MFERTRIALVVALLALFAAAVPPQLVRAATFTVDNPNDSGAGSLRAAITAANASAGPDTISFNLGAAATWTINLASSLPDITGGSTTIDGPLDAQGKPRVAINGLGINFFGSPSYGQGLAILSSNNVVRGLAIYGFDGQPSNNPYGIGIVIDGGQQSANSNTIENCFIGVSLNGTSPGTTAPAVNNGNGGIAIYNGASNNIIQNNVVCWQPRYASLRYYHSKHQLVIPSAHRRKYCS